MPSHKIPSVVKHMTLAVYRGPALTARDGSGVSQGQVDKFKSAFNIALARLVEYGHLMPGSQSGKVEDIRLTSLGRLLEYKHSKEGMKGPMKNMAFDVLYAVLHQKKAEAEKKGEHDHHAITTVKKGDTPATTQQKAHKPDAAKAKKATPKAGDQF